MPLPKEIESISSYLRAWAPELGERILQTYPPLQGFEDAASKHIGELRRNPFPAQTLAIMGVVKRWNEARGAAVIAECGTGKTLTLWVRFMCTVSENPLLRSLWYRPSWLRNGREKPF